MRRGQLPLTALRSFEAAGRHLSFTRAAEELLVSQAAVSRQVRDLEAWLGRKLFERHHRHVILTEEGRLLLGQLTAGFDQMERLLQGLRSTPAQTILSISVEPTFATYWLVPRLERFRRQRPDIDIAIASDVRLTEFRGDDSELAIRYGAKATSWPRLQAEKITSVVMSPVLAPTLLTTGPALKGPGDMRSYTLLHEDNDRSWARWFQYAGIVDISARRGPLYANLALVLQSAIRGHGVALVDTLLAEDDLKAGRLVKPFDIDVPSGAYWFVAPDLEKLSEPASAFTDWVRSEFGKAT